MCQGQHTCGHPSSLGDTSPLKVIFSVPSFISAHLFLSQIILIYISWGINDDFQVHALPIPKFQLSVWGLSSWPASEPLMFPDSCPQMFPTAFRLPLNITFPKGNASLAKAFKAAPTPRLQGYSLSLTSCLQLSEHRPQSGNGFFSDLFTGEADRQCYLTH